MLIAIAAIAFVWVTVGVLVWAACAAASRADVATLGPELGAAGAASRQRRAAEAAERLTVWESLPGLPIRDGALRTQGAR